MRKSSRYSMDENNLYSYILVIVLIISVNYHHYSLLTLKSFKYNNIPIMFAYFFDFIAQLCNFKCYTKSQPADSYYTQVSYSIPYCSQWTPDTGQLVNALQIMIIKIWKLMIGN